MIKQKIMKQLTAKNGQSEWPYKGKTLIAVPEKNGCYGCVFIAIKSCINKSPTGISCLPSDNGFDESIIYVEKPAKK